MNQFRTYAEMIAEANKARTERDRYADALRWIAEHESNDAEIDAYTEHCPNSFHTTRQVGDNGGRCPACFSRWWATDGSRPSAEGSYALGAVAAKALADA